MTKIEVEEAVQYIMRVEGLEVEEAKLTYARRQKLKAGSFCGPKRSYPAHDAAHVRNAFARLSQFGHRLKPSVRKSIHGCLVRRAKRFGVEHKGCRFCKSKKSVSETVDWYLEKHKEDLKPCETC